MELTKKEGFTLIEVLIALAIVVTMGAVVGPPMMRWIKQSKIDATNQSMKAIETALVSYYSDMGKFPSTAEGLDALVVEPAGASGRWHGYLDKMPIDAWNNDFEYNSYRDIKNKDKGFTTYEIISYGEGGVEGGSEYEAEIIIGK